MQVLIAGFEGNDNSAKILLDNIKEECDQDILYLENDFEVSGNNIFFRALNFKEKNNLKSKVGFVHIPTADNIKNIKNLTSTILNYINTLSK